MAKCNFTAEIWGPRKRLVNKCFPSKAAAMRYGRTQSRSKQVEIYLALPTGDRWMLGQWTRGRWVDV